MPSGTTVEIFAPRIHKQNARECLECATEDIRSIERLLIGLVSQTSPYIAGQGLDGASQQPVHEYAAYEVPRLIEQLFDAWRKAYVAGAIIDDPDSCRDELESVEV